MRNSHCHFSRLFTLVSAVSLASAALFTGARADDLQPLPPLEKAWQELPHYQFGQSRAAYTAVHNAVRDSLGKADVREQIAHQLVAILDAPDATTDAKRLVLRDLRDLASDAAVPSVAKALADDKFTQLAAGVLEGTPTPAASAALREAVRTLKGPSLVGVIRALGERRDGQAVDELAVVLKWGDPAARMAAAIALGHVGIPGAQAPLRSSFHGASADLKRVIAEACFECAEHLGSKGTNAAGVYYAFYTPDEPPLVRAAALRGLVRWKCSQATVLVIEALQSDDARLRLAAAESVKEPEVSDGPVLDVLPKLLPDAQAVTLGSLAARGAREAYPIATHLVTSDDPRVKLAAVRAIAALGDAPAASLLASTAAGAKGELQAAAREGLDRLGGAAGIAAVDEALTHLAASTQGAERIEVLRALGARHVTSATGEVMKLAADEDPAVRVQAYKTLADLAEGKDAPALLDLLAKKVRGEEERTAAEAAVVAACRRIGRDKDADAAPVFAVVGPGGELTMEAHLRILARLLGPKAVAAIVAAANSPDTEISDAAVRALADAPDDAVSEPLLALAQDTRRPEHQRIVALRGYIRLATDPSMTDDDVAFKRLSTALALATRPDEKRQVLGGLGKIRSVEALNAVLPLIDDPGVREEAARAAVAIATYLPQERKLVESAMAKVIAATKSESVKEGARKLLPGSSGPKP